METTQNSAPDIKMEPSWKEKLASEFAKPYFSQLIEFVKEEYAVGPVYPPGNRIFHAFDATPYDKVNVVLLGQDPYHGKGQAHGLAFSVNDGVRVPPSLQNIYKEIHADTGRPVPKSGNLERWAQQGVLLLNTTLTVREALPGSHQKKGWEEFTDAVIKLLSADKEGVVFLLWGAFAQKKAALIDEKKHLILKAPHPASALYNPGAANGWFGNKHFSQTNTYLESQGKQPIEW